MKNLLSFCLVAALGLGLGASACAVDATGDDTANVVGRKPFPRNPNVVDRMGRPEVTNFMVRIPQQKVAYNAADAYALDDAQKAKFGGLIAAGIAAWDAFDGKVDWSPEAGQKTLAGTFAQDFLLVDTSKTCGVDTDSYLDLELSPPGENQTCGGRTPNPDVIDRIMSVLIAGPAGGRSHGDGVNGVPRPAVDAFPYLVEPHPTPAPAGGGT